MTNNLKNKNILLCITGSIAAYKSCEIIRSLTKEGAQVQVAISKSGLEFIGAATLAAISNNKVITELFPKSPKAGLEHIDLAFDLDLIVIAPATANILCKSGNGVADDLISTIISVCEQKQIFFPAMNHRMWQNQATIDAVEKLRMREKIVINPEEGHLASLHTGEGRLPTINKIINEIKKCFDYVLHLENQNILVTAGPTREPIDPVRFISNRSSGKMGYSIAKICTDYGGNVDLISGPTNLQIIPNVNTINIETTNELYDKMIFLLEEKKYKYIFMVAAVADYQLKKIKNHKIKSKDDNLNLKFMKSVDIIKKISKKNEGITIGFALETENGERNAKEKMRKKDLDYIILNYANEENAGFESNTNHVYMYSKNGFKKEFKLDRKDRIAKKIIDSIIKND
ncbi:MAG: bifunctional phosphopantothenoylcysteine decarboxylase/phosphopantothenate--cysteine ligase CoaBC [Candidatus Marinimicrobia bacterium]|nr:bifunctional phosphopantothenoylcysteine decarboxylase/phosphopantothenate--cysteine ligase CoaBC [Candidatus Neomarinimicrobiota bacterium]